jgi:hypothetical protein
MTTALHLVHVHQLPPGPQRKRKGGGGGDGYDALVERVYQDKRMASESRELILLLAWLIKKDPARFDAEGNYLDTWDRAEKVLGSNGLGRSQTAVLIDADRPRYEPDMREAVWQERRCSAPMARRTGECGQHATAKTFKIDPVTGWHAPIWYCSRHRGYGDACTAELRAMDFPEPIPNRGGLLPSFLVLKTGDEGWKRLYAWGSDVARSRWEPPVKYSLRADDWPLPGKEPAPEPFRLRLAAMDGELIGGEA